MNDFLTNWKENKTYFEALSRMASLTKLFNNYRVPKLDYQFCENCFCKWYNFNNISVGSSSFDTEKDGLGVGNKTYQYNGNTTLEKVSEFNKIAPELRGLSNIEIVCKISTLKNERFLKDAEKFKIEKAIYHHVARREKKGIKELLIFNSDYSLIDISNIIITKNTDKKIIFNDGKNEFNFVFSKSTLYQRFIVPEDAVIIPVDICEDPWSLLIK